MKKTLYTAFMAVAALSLGSCSDFLDKESTAYDSDGFYKSEAGMNDGVTAIYRLVPYDQNWAVPVAVMQDVYCPYGLMADENNTISAGGGLTPDQTYVNSYWSGHWAIVARANNVVTDCAIDNTTLFDPNAGVSDTYKRRYCEAIAVRDYAYYNLVQAFGDIPFFPKAVTPEQYTEPRHDKEEIIDYIINELTAIGEAEILPWTPEQTGRVGNGMIYNLIARFGLLGGSHNVGGKGQDYYRIAANAAKKVMDHHKLATNFNDLFTHAGQALSTTRSEILWEYTYCLGAVNHTHKMRYGHTSRTAGGSSVRFPSNMLAVVYECADGLRIDESPLYDPTKPFMNRDPRFRHTILMHGDTMWFSNHEKAIEIDCYGKTSSQYPNPRQKGKWYKYNNLAVTGTAYSEARDGVGMLWNKYNQDETEGFSDSTLDLIIMRAAEAYLTYAEAKIELGELDQTVYDAINTVRRRAGQIDFNKAVPARVGNQDLMRQIVRRERKVELAMEGILLTDFRRWKIGDILNEEPVYGQPIADIKFKGLTKADMPTFKKTDRHNLNDVPSYTAAGVTEKYTARDVKRFWAERFLWWPIPRTDLDRNPNLTNPEGY